MFTDLGNIFYDAEGTFQWASIAAGVSLIAAVISIWGTVRNNKIQKEINQQNIDANLKAKARIEWITDVRENTSKYLSSLSYLSNLIITLKYTLFQIDRMTQLSRANGDNDNSENHLVTLVNELENEYNTTCSEVEKLEIDIIAYSEKILLYFSEQPDHTEIIAEISEPKSIVTIIKDAARNKNIENLTATHVRTANSIQNIRSLLRDYLKLEWDRAKNSE